MDVLLLWKMGRSDIINLTNYVLGSRKWLSPLEGIVTPQLTTVLTVSTALGYGG